MAKPLPTVGGDSGTWGTKLNAFLGVEHNASDGTHKMGVGLVTESVNTVVASGVAQIIPDLSAATLNYITLTASCTITLPTAVAGQSFTLVLKQGGSGSYTVIWVSAKWAGGIAPTLSSAVNALDVLVFICVDGSNWLGFVSGQDMK